MKWRLITRGGVGLVALGAAGGGAWILSLPPAPTATGAPPIAKGEADAIVIAASWPGERLLPPLGGRQPARALDEALAGIEARYGMRTADFVAMQLEYPRSSRSAAIHHATH